LILAKNIPINGQTSIDHFFADQFRITSNSKYAWSKDHSNKSQWIMAQAANVLKTVVP
jgi:hypothetical protein